MSSGFEQYGDEFAGASSAGQHGSQMALTRSLEGRMMSTRDYRQNVARDNARVHNGDQHHHYYTRPGDGPDMSKDPMHQLLKSLSFPQRNYRFTTIEPAYRQTCQWLFETPEYVRWRNRDLRQAHHGILWLKGKPGAGKSTIIKHALEYANAMYPDERNIHFFFNARGDRLEKCTEGMFRSLLHQVAQDVPSLLQSVPTEAVEGYARTGWPLDLLRSCFRQAVLQLASTAHLNCYIDALDEGEDESETREMVRFLEDLAETAVSRNIGFSIYFASRHYPNITIGRSEIIVLDGYKGHRDDIANYVWHKLSCQPPSLKAELVTNIIERSSGIFLWVVLVVRMLNTESDRGNQHHLKRSLQATPKGLDDLFGDIVCNDDADGLMLPTLRWVLFANRLLSPLELYIAVVYCTNPDSSSSVIWDYATIDETSIKNFITSNSKGLLEIVVPTSFTDIWERGQPSNETGAGLVVQFIHESVREYLLELGLQRLDSTLTGNLVGISNLRLARWCQSYVELSLQHGAFPPVKEADVYMTSQLLQHLRSVAPFSRYALAAILYHSEKAASYGLDVPIPFEDCLCTHLPRSAVFMKFFEPVPVYQTMLHVLAGGGYTALATKLLQRYSQTARQSYINLKVEGGFDNCSTALHLGARWRSLELTRVLLENGADVNAQDRNGETTLLYAARLGLTKMTQMLLNHGADANIGDTRGNVALHFVCGTESLESFETLMRNDADLNVLNYEGYTPIMSAIKSLKPSYGTPLPSHARDMNGMHGDSHTSFHHAKSWSSFGDTSILGVLLQHGADPNLRGSNIGPLLTAVVRNSAHALEDVQMLLRYGADVNASDNFGTTALHAAIMRQRIDIIDTLLQHNADVNVCVEQHTTPLMLAISLQASTEVVEILLKHGADVNFVTWWNVTALRTAVELGNVEVTRMLLDYGADVHSQEGWGKGIVNIAYGDSSEIITRLSSNFADVPPRLRSETASALEHQDWLKDYLRRNKVR